MSSREFHLDDNNTLLNIVYENNNYKILNGINKEGIYLIFCSGNGLYFPNELEVFKETIICNDRYEWAHIATEMINYVEKIIFLRDVRKNFYVTGINRKINCIDKIVEFLRCVCSGHKTVAIGNSAGGYLASIIGAKLHAQAVFNFSGQWNLYGHGDVVENDYYLSKFAESEMHNRYFNITQLVKNSGVPVFYFYPRKSEQDVKQASYVHDFSNIFSFALDSNKHGQGLTAIGDYIKLFMSDYEMLKKLSLSYHDILLEPDTISRLVSKLLTCKAILSDIADIEKTNSKKTHDKQKLSDKYLDLFLMMNQWVKVKQEGKNLAYYFEKNGYNKIAVYGMGNAGKTLIRELEGSNVQVVYGIDQNADSISAGIDVVTMENDLAEVDAVVVTAISFFYEIKNKLINRMDCTVISLKEVIYEL